MLRPEFKWLVVKNEVDRQSCIIPPMLSNLRPFLVLVSIGLLNVIKTTNELNNNKKQSIC